MTVTIRGPRLQKSGIRWTGRDLTVTTCPAAEPQVAFAIGEAEIIERATELEIFGRDLALQLSSVNVLPLPDAHFFTGSQSQFPIKRMSGTYSRREGVRAEVVLGLPWNTTGGAIHEFLTGRPASEFRGDWELGLGYWETRGTPVNPRLMYSVPGLYSGRTEAYYMDDRGPNIREIQRNIDGSLIATESRGLIRSENRFQIGESRTSICRRSRRPTRRCCPSSSPSTTARTNAPRRSAFLYHQTDNHIITFGTRSTLDDFSYRSDRGLAPRFVEELPVVTWNWLAQPIGETPWETPIILDAATELGQRRSNFDDRFGSRVSDRTFRADQDIEISAPFALGPINVRPFVATRGTFYDNTIAGDNESRVALTAGIEAGTRLSRDFSWVGSDGPTSIRHVIAPRVFLIDRFHVDDNASELFQFDGTDALAEQTLVRFELRNLLQKNQPDGTTASRDFLLLDLAQDFWPDASRDNGGDELGLFLLRPHLPAGPGVDAARHPDARALRRSRLGRRASHARHRTAVRSHRGAHVDTRVPHRRDGRRRGRSVGHDPRVRPLGSRRGQSLRPRPRRLADLFVRHPAQRPRLVDRAHGQLRPVPGPDDGPVRVRADPAGLRPVTQPAVRRFASARRELRDPILRPSGSGTQS